MEQMVRLVEEAGLSLVEIRDADTDQAVSEVSERVLVVAREQGK